MTKKKCAVCENPIQQRVGSSLERCVRCDRPCCDKHWFVCVDCAAKVCGNDLSGWKEGMPSSVASQLRCKPCHRASRELLT